MVSEVFLKYSSPKIKTLGHCSFHIVLIHLLLTMRKVTTCSNARIVCKANRYFFSNGIPLLNLAVTTEMFKRVWS